MSQLSAEPIRVGVMPPLSGLGATHGPEISWAGQIARAEINAAGGILGRPLELIVADDGGLPETATRTAERLLDMGCLALIGTRSAVASLVAEPRETPYLNCAFHAGSPGGRFFFSFGALPNQRIERLIPYMARMAGSRMFLVGTSQAWSRVCVETATHALRTHGGDLVGAEYLTADRSDLDAVLERLGHCETDVLLPFLEGQAQLDLLMQLHRRGLKKRIAVVLCNFDEAMAARLSPEVREGLYASNTYFMSVDNTANRRYLTALAALGDVDGIWPAGMGMLTSVGEAAYLCIHAFARAANAAGSLASPDLVKALEQTRLDAPQGEVRMEPATHQAHLHHYLARCDFDGAFRIVKHFGTCPPAIPERHAVAASNDTDRREQEGIIAIAVAGIGGDGRISFVNRTLLRLWGFPDDRQLAGVSIAQLWEDADALAAIMPALTRMPEWSGPLTARLADGRLKRLMVVAEPMLHGSGTMTGYTLACVDTRSLSLQQQHASYKILAMADVAVIAVTDEGIILEANRRTGEIFGYRTQEIVGRSIHDLVPSEFRQQHVHQLRGFVKGTETERRMGMRNDVAGVRKDGSVFPAEVSISRFKSGGDWILVATLRDITDRKLAENELLWRASHDSLTGLPNRTMIHERLSRALQRSAIQGHAVALLFVDLDGFKLINDSHGHATGDELLKDVARRLLEQIRPGDTVGRLGGDEFAILCDQVSSPVGITALAERIIDMLRAPLELRGHRLFVTASIGLAMGHGATHSADDLLRNADAAMYNVKEQGRNDWRFFSEEIHDQVRKRLDITNGLRLAIERNELRVRFQPILCIEDRRIRGAELLLRWYPPTGEITPDHFIPIAEMTGSIVPIGKWVFEQACLAQAAWIADHGSQAPYVSVNISARQLNDETLVASFREDLARTGADPTRVRLELTETSLMSDADANLRVLRQLAELGMNVAVDDFGTGHSSLSQLLRMPVSTLKIDREFVDGIDKRHDSKAIVSAVSSMARAMKLEVIAEGVENECQLAYLRDIGCDCVQGFLFHRPMPTEDFSRLLGEQAANRPVATQDGLHTILYVSLATDPMSQGELSQLLEHSRKYNRDLGVTGFLLYLNGSFMQMLEGEQSQIQTLLEHIARDPRHHSLRTVYQGRIDERIFGDWSMGFRDMDHVEQGYDFQAWQARTLNFLDMSEDARICYSLIAAFAR